jgi:RNA polymerase sigma-70 factor (ECF subfamily)
MRPSPVSPVEISDGATDMTTAVTDVGCVGVAGSALAEEDAAGPGHRERALVARARDGDHEAFRILVERHEGRVHALALRILRDPEWARDAVQEAFIKAYRALRRFEGRSSFNTWLYRLTYNHCLDMRRADKTHRHVEWDEERMSSETGDPGGSSPGEDPPLLPGAPPGPAQALERSELRVQLVDAIATLPEDARQTLVMREVDGMSYAEIAQVLQVPKGTVMSRLHNARKKVREILTQRDVTPSTRAANPSRSEVGS